MCLSKAITLASGSPPTRQMSRSPSTSGAPLMPHDGTGRVEVLDVVLLPQDPAVGDVEGQQVAHRPERVDPVAVDGRRRPRPDGVGQLEAGVVGLPLVRPEDRPGLLVQREDTRSTAAVLLRVGTPRVGDEDTPVRHRRVRRSRRGSASARWRSGRPLGTSRRCRCRSRRRAGRRPATPASPRRRAARWPRQPSRGRRRSSRWRACAHPLTVRLIDTAAVHSDPPACAGNHQRRGRSGCPQRSPGNRAKSLSVVINSHPCSMASAARYASVTNGPWMRLHSPTKMSQC